LRGWFDQNWPKLAAILAVLVLFGSPLLALKWATSVPGASYTGALPALTERQAGLAARLKAHVVAIASEPHNIGHPEALERSAIYIETTLAADGHAVAAQRFDKGLARNIETIIAPADPTAATLVIGAHYDSAFTAPGANDNGSGVAALLELAHLLKDMDGRAPMRFRLVFFANEEPPFFKTDLMGSAVYANRLVASGERVEGMISLETIGYYSDAPGSQHYPFPLSAFYPSTGNFVAFVGTTGSRPLVRKTIGRFRKSARFPSVGGTAPGFIQGIDWSDHWAFEHVGIPALMITDTAPFRYPWYHHEQDTPNKLDYPRLSRVVTELERMLRDWR
jgi:Zn-dependent M28 family amino/carboxypeptidase